MSGRPVGKTGTSLPSRPPTTWSSSQTNASDFRRLYARQQLHTGLILILPNVDRPTEARLFAAGLAQLAQADDLVNQVMEIDLDSGQVKFRIYDLFALPD
jgi:hypothetical protein